MAKLRFNISISLDGFVAGPNQSVDHPLGIGGEGLHAWVTSLAVWRKPHGLAGGAENVNTQVVEENTRNIGATIMGRNMFGGHPGPWDPQAPWQGWWGDIPPFGHPVFVITNHSRAPLELGGGTTFYFVTGGIQEAHDRAFEAAGGRDVTLGGGAQAAQQFLAAGLVDEIELHMVPILLGDGARLFEGVGANLHGLKLVRTIPTDQVVHMKFARD